MRGKALSLIKNEENKEAIDLVLQLKNVHQQLKKLAVLEKT